MALDKVAVAARLFAASERVRQELGIEMAARYQAEVDAKKEQARSMLGDESFALAWQEGWAMPLAEAVKLAEASV